ncbi:MAG: SDR family NAD(P)-dependent oxidoreductase, partial [Myxococcota bacterium]
KQTRFRDEFAKMASFVRSDRSHHADPLPVAQAVLEFMTVKAPKLRYLVTPNRRESDYTIKRALQKVVQLNRGHAFSMTNTELRRLLEALPPEASR